MAPYPTQKSFSAGSEFPPTTPGRLRIYSMRFCPFAQRTQLVLAHKNLEFETVNVDLKRKPDWFLAKNPLGLVPVLELDDKILYESTATSEWLDDMYTQNRLTPADPFRKAEDRILLEYLGKLISCYISLYKTQDNREKLHEEIHKHYKFYEDALAKRGSKFFGGEEVAMFDFYIWPFIERIPGCMDKLEPESEITTERYPRLSAWIDAMNEVPAVKATRFSPEDHLHYLKTSMAGNPDYDYLL